MGDGKPARVALFARISTTVKGQELANQLEPLREFARQQGWIVVREFVDETSESRFDRVGVQALLEAAASRQYDVLLFWSLDRLSRQGALQTLEMLHRLTELGVAWRSYTEPDLDSAGVFGEAIVALLATLAKQERLRLQERVRAGLMRARRDGKRLGRPRRVFDRRRVVELRLTGMSWRQIAAAMGISTGLARRVWLEQKNRCAQNPKPAGGQR